MLRNNGFLYFALGIAAFSLAVVAWQQKGRGMDLMDTRSAELAGKDGIDCGRVKLHVSPKAATDCALAAQQAGKPFRVIYDLQGIDSFVALALIRTPNGILETLTYDSDPAGGGGRANEVVSKPKACPVPVHMYVNPSGRINCFQPQTAQRKDAMSPNLEPY